MTVSDGALLRALTCLSPVAKIGRLHILKMPWAESDWEPVSSIRETYDNLLQTHLEDGGKVENFVPWELFREDMRQATRGKVPDEYNEYDLKITKEGHIIESFNGEDNILYLPYRRGWGK